MLNREKLEAKYQASVADCINRFLAFAEPHKAHFKELQARHPEDVCDLSELDPQKEFGFAPILGICTASMGEIIAQNAKNGGVEDTSDYAITIGNFGKECMDLHVAFFETNAAVCKYMIKFGKETIQRITKDRNKYLKNPKLQKIKREMDEMITYHQELLSVNQLQVIELDLLYREVRGSKIMIS